MRPPRGLSAGEQALWARLTHTVKPLHLKPVAALPAAPPPVPAAAPASPAKKVKGRVPPLRPEPPRPAAPVALNASTLDSHWERRLRAASIAPDFTLDLHGHSLDQAHRRLDAGLGQAKAMGARLVLVITGKPRPVDAADRATHRGAIRAKILDWLAAGPHASDIAAIRPAHRRHGGEGAVYLVLRRR